VDGLLTEHLIINMGPQHPSTHGVLRLLIEVDGEEVLAVESSVGYLHRGIEKLAEHRRYNAIGTLMDRGDYVSGIHGELAIALATEQLMEIEVPAKANWIRSLTSELNRLASHLLWFGTFGLDTGAMGPFLYAMRDREAILDILEAVSGQRMMFNYVRPGGVVADLPAGIDAKVRAFLDGFEGVYLKEHHALLGGNEIFQDRVKGIGTITQEQALAFGLTGANLRATGIPFDVARTARTRRTPSSTSRCPWASVATAGTATWCVWAR
jgi:NADH-quinone oxidoreductase subunit D